MAKLVKGVNDLATIYPDIAEEWDPEANGFGPDDVMPGSGKRIIWVCGKGHHYSAIIKNRTKRRTGCPYCSGRLPIKGKTDLQTIYPDLAEEWDYERNKKGPDEYTYASNQMVYWVCKKGGHSFKAQIYSRTGGSGCPYCAGQLPIKGKTDLQTMRPDLAEEWDYKRNEKGPDEYCAVSGKKVYWVCKKENHSFKARIYSRTSGSGCPYCAGQLPIKGKTDLQTMRPDLAEEWDYECNEKGPDEYCAVSGKKVYWICKKENHSFKARINSRTSGSGCPYCSGRLPIKGKTDLQTMYPDLAEEWDYERNEKGPDEYTYASHQMIYWVCKKEGHSFKSRIYSRTSGNGCPYCNRKK